VSMRLMVVVIERCYGKEGVRLEFTVDEVLASFSDLALFNS
jgi:hypothetical protein